MATPTVTDLLSRNKASLASYNPRPLISEFAAFDYSLPTSILVTCCDYRVQPEEFFGLVPGEVSVFRNAGGRVWSSLNDIVMLDTFLGPGKLKQLLIVHHTDCGATHFKDEDLKAKLISL